LPIEELPIARKQDRTKAMPVMTSEVIIQDLRIASQPWRME